MGGGVVVVVMPHLGMRDGLVIVFVWVGVHGVGCVVKVVIVSDKALMTLL